jgi:hypothetical protein
MPAATAAPGHRAPAKPRRRARGIAHSVNQLLQNHGALSQLVRHVPMQQSWAEWLRAQVPAELAQHLVSVLPKPGGRAASGVFPARAGAASAVAELIVFADSAAWSMRLRYALAALQEQIDARAGTPVRIGVRVVMESTASGH